MTNVIKFKKKSWTSKLYDYLNQPKGWFNVLVTIAATTMGVVCVIAMMLACWWAMWKLWLFAIPQLFPEASLGIQQPSYWLFVCCMLILLWIKGFIRGMLNKEKDED